MEKAGLPTALTRGLPTFPVSLLSQVMLPLFCATRAATVVLALAEVAATKMNGQLSAVLAGVLGFGAGVARGSGGVRSKCNARRASAAWLESRHGLADSLRS